jgi:hypothetical protein
MTTETREPFVFWTRWEVLRIAAIGAVLACPLALEIADLVEHRRQADALAYLAPTAASR